MKTNKLLALVAAVGFMAAPLASQAAPVFAARISDGINSITIFDGSADDAVDIILRRIGMLDHVLTPEYVDMLTGSTRDGSGKSSLKTRSKSRPKTTSGATMTGASGEQQDKGLRGDGSQKDEKNDSYDEFDEPESGSSSSSASKAKI